ncbi:MAG: hypothetical protein M3406_02965 [Chloroflexota bacterium]|nr:hypothetical protein [Chloroflexota bacterium]
MAVLALTVVASMTLGGEYGVNYATPGSESKAASETLAAEYGGRSSETVDVVYSSADGPVTDQKVTEPVDELLAEAGELEGLTGGVTAKDAEVSPDERTAVVSVPLDRQGDSVPVTYGRIAALDG